MEARSASSEALFTCFERVGGCSDYEAWLAFHSGRVSLRLGRGPLLMEAGSAKVLHHRLLQGMTLRLRPVNDLIIPGVALKRTYSNYASGTYNSKCFPLVWSFRSESLFSQCLVLWGPLFPAPGLKAILTMLLGRSLPFPLCSLFSKQKSPLVRLSSFSL